MSAVPYYVRAQQDWSVQQEIIRHDQALYSVGENAMFVLMWTVRDFEDGLVGYCATCSTDAISMAYRQPTQNRCPDCFGTRYEGGYRALIVRPAIFQDTDDNQQFSARGVSDQAETTIESTSDFRVHAGDYVLRATGERYRLRVPTRTTIRTGFGTAFQRTTEISYAMGSAALEDEASVAYTIPPHTSDLITILTRSGPTPVSFSDVEVIRAPLVPIPPAPEEAVPQ
jgi:hypothetical protein